MKISTKTGDGGRTCLMFAREVSKNSLRVRAYGAVDELSATLGMARALASDSPVAEEILDIQKKLIPLMTELATAPEDFAKLSEKKITILSQEDLDVLERRIEDFESAGDVFAGWKLSGENALQAALDVSRAKCRSAERDVVALAESEKLPRDFPIVWLNRLADLLWLMANATTKE